MTKLTIVGIAGILFLASCTNDNSSTTGSYDTEETPEQTEMPEHSETKDKAAKEEGAESVDTSKVSNGDSINNTPDSATNKSVEGNKKEKHL